MNRFSQGDLIRIQGFHDLFLIISNNTFIQSTYVFHVCPVLDFVKEGPLHIPVAGRQGSAGTAICEQLKLIDPSVRGCNRVDRIPYDQIMNVSDAIQGIFEYD